MNIDDIQQEQVLATYDGEDKVVPGNVIYDTIKKQSKPKLHFYSKLPKLDSITDGFIGGQLVVISGTTGHGKTTLCQTLCLNAQTQGLLSTWFSYELQPEYFLEQFPDDTMHNILMPSILKGRSAEWIELRSWEAKLKYKSNIVFIDHLHFLVDVHKSRNISFDVGSVVRNLKLLALKHNLVVFLICHTMKTKEDVDMELGLGSVRDSSLIEQEADQVYYIWRDIETDTRSILKVAKNRKKGIINKKIRLVYVNGKLFEEANTEENTRIDTRNRARMDKGNRFGSVLSKGE